MQHRNRSPFEALDYAVAEGDFVEPVPDLRKVPQRRWREVLMPLSPPARRRAVHFVAWEDHSRAVTLINELDMEFPDTRWGIAVPPEQVRTRIPFPDAATSEGRRGRQLNVRLRPDDHARLEYAADLLALTPTQLARTFIVNGVLQLLSDAP